MVIDVLRSMGDVLFHGIAVKPGKPTVLGRVDGKAVLGMPGYPTSCLSNCYLILAPMLRRMARLPEAHVQSIEVPLAKRLVSTIGRVEFHTVRIADGEAVPAYKESGAITSMAHADGYIEILRDPGHNLVKVASGEVPDSVVNREVLDRPGFRKKLERYR